MVQLGARWYWPEIGRFIQQDPIGDGINWYAYGGNNPVVWVDPLGEKWYNPFTWSSRPFTWWQPFSWGNPPAPEPGEGAAQAAAALTTVSLVAKATEGEIEAAGSSARLAGMAGTVAYVGVAAELGGGVAQFYATKPKAQESGTAYRNMNRRGMPQGDPMEDPVYDIDAYRLRCGDKYELK